MKRRVVFRADGNSEIGYGHFIRTLGIAGLINERFHCVFATLSPSDYQLAEIRKVCHEVSILEDNNLLSDEFLQFLDSNDIVVLDHYNFLSSYQLEIRKKGCVVIYIDDFNNKHYVCDTLINNIPGFFYNDFRKESYTELCLGSDYALLRREFFDREFRTYTKVDNKILVAFGGSDKFNLSEKIIEYLYKIDNTLELHLLIGDGYKYVERLQIFPNLFLHKNVSAKTVAELIATSNVCIVPASSLVNEVASIGSRLLIGYFADNQINPYEYFVNNGLAIGLNDYRKLSYTEFRFKFLLAFDSDELIDRQRSIYRYQQMKNIQNIFFRYEKG